MLGAGRGRALRREQPDAALRGGGRLRRRRARARPRTRRRDASWWRASCSSSTSRCSSTPTGSSRSATARSCSPSARRPPSSRRTRASSARLLGVPAAEVAARRLEHVRSAATRSNATVLLKGEATIVADPSGRAYVVPTGNPGLATPGTGDVLSGVIAAQLAKGLGATDAACLGAYLHGLAADLAAERRVRHRGHGGGRPADVPAGGDRAAQGGPARRTHEHDVSPDQKAEAPSRSSPTSWSPTS